MTDELLDAARESEIGVLVEHYISNQRFYQLFLDSLRGLAEQQPLSDYVHSLKGRLKHPDSLRDKLRRKMKKAEADGSTFDITTDNLFEKINDLAGLRILHLYTRQIEHIHAHLLESLAEAKWPLMEAPFARTWDDESRAYFKTLGIETRDSESMYTSVHYVVEANQRTKRTGEIQVRTLAEELWGEVDHTINYPHPSDKRACKEQILVLARATSTCSRLVDSIFITHEGLA